MKIMNPGADKGINVVFLFLQSESKEFKHRGHVKKSGTKSLNIFSQMYRPVDDVSKYMPVVCQEYICYFAVCH